MSQINTKKKQEKRLYLVIYFISVFTAFVVFLYLTRFLGLSLRDFVIVAEVTLLAGLIPVVIGIILIKFIFSKKLSLL